MSRTPQARKLAIVRQVQSHIGHPVVPPTRIVEAQAEQCGVTPRAVRNWLAGKGLSVREPKALTRGQLVMIAQHGCVHMTWPHRDHLIWPHL